MARRRKAGDATTAVAYIRVSTDEQTLGPEAQRAALERWATAQGVRLVAVFEDLGVSGACPVDSRPALLDALAALRTHGAGVLVALKRDRLARDTFQAAMIEKLVLAAGARLRTVDGMADGDGPEAVLMRRVLDAFAEFERLLIAARTRAALHVKKRRGERTGSVPFGFALAPDGVHLVAVPAEQATCAAARALRAGGLSLREVGERLAALGHLPRTGKAWHPQQVARALREADTAAGRGLALAA